MVFNESSMVPKSPTVMIISIPIPMPLSFCAFSKKLLRYVRTVCGAKGRRNENSCSTCSDLTSVKLVSINATETIRGINVSSITYASADARVKQLLRVYSEKTIRIKMINRKTGRVRRLFWIVNVSISSLGSCAKFCQNFFVNICMVLHGDL
jgi:hypothetical protein